uniref:Mediator of RNA polymerase II transcription subunit 9 n=1 Tax=Haptolina brevifila TaxID=156173 RepID=A0A7S2ISA7_9EUKA|mmetsp:Transcript_7073/g.14474  ORF Transcript_7073/g.14474 Transcript_7073/m.14474 type:complete len:135 (+) Transcript_7073:72-476(+)
MLETGDDDDVLEQLETEELQDQRATRRPEHGPVDLVAEPEEDPNAVISREDFVLLPLVNRLIRAHQTGPQAAAAAMAELRRGMRRAERKLAVLESATAPLADQRELEDRVQTRAALLDEHSRKRRLDSLAETTQ